jgi:hypothetical protein
MQPQLKDCINLMPVSFSIYINASAFQGLSTTGFSQITSAPMRNPNRTSYMCIKPVIEAACIYIMYGCAIATQFFTMPVKPFKPGEEICIGEIAIRYSNRIIFIQCRQKVIAGILNRFHVSWCNKPPGPLLKQNFSKIIYSVYKPCYYPGDIHPCFQDMLLYY